MPTSWNWITETFCSVGRYVGIYFRIVIFSDCSKIQFIDSLDRESCKISNGGLLTVRLICNG